MTDAIDAELASQLGDVIDAIEAVRWADVVDVDDQDVAAFNRQLIEARSRLLHPRVITDGGVPDVWGIALSGEEKGHIYREETVSVESIGVTQLWEPGLDWSEDNTFSLTVSSELGRLNVWLTLVEARELLKAVETHVEYLESRFAEERDRIREVDEKRVDGCELQDAEGDAA